MLSNCRRYLLSALKGQLSRLHLIFTLGFRRRKKPLKGGKSCRRVCEKVQQLTRTPSSRITTIKLGSDREWIWIRSRSLTWSGFNPFLDKLPSFAFRSQNKQNKNKNVRCRPLVICYIFLIHKPLYCSFQCLRRNLIVLPAIISFIVIFLCPQSKNINKSVGNTIGMTTPIFSYKKETIQKLEAIRSCLSVDIKRSPSPRCLSSETQGLPFWTKLLTQIC